MYDRVLFPTDGSEGAKAIFDRVLDIVADHGATLHVLNVADTRRDSVTRIQGKIVDALEREGERIVEEAAASAANRGVGTVTDVVQGSVPETITTYVEEYDVDLVVMPTRGRTGLERYLLGSTTERVVRTATAPVLTLRPDNEPSRYPYENVLVATDGSDHATAALEYAVDIVNAAGATLHVLSVVEMPAPGLDVDSERQVDALEAQAEQVVAEAAASAEAASVGSVVEAIEFAPSVHRAIRTYADENGVDLVVMGTHGRTGFERYLLGSVAEKTVRTAPVPVLTVPAPDAEA